MIGEIEQHPQLRGEHVFAPDSESSRDFLQRLENSFAKPDQKSYIRFYWASLMISLHPVNNLDQVYDYVGDANIFLHYLKGKIAESHSQDTKFNRDVFFASVEGKKFLAKYIFLSIAGIFLGYRPTASLSFEHKSLHTKLLEGLQSMIEAKIKEVHPRPVADFDYTLLKILGQVSLTFEIPLQVINQIDQAATFTF